MPVHLEEQLEEARRHFLAYEFRAAYHKYRRCFSSAPFQITESQLDHLGHYARTLLELNRTEELRFYLPILESHFERVPAPYAAYALAYILDHVGHGNRARRLFEQVKETAGDPDLRIKATMMLARLSPSEEERIRLIESVTVPPKDPHLKAMWEIWRCICLRYRGNGTASAESLVGLIARLEAEPEKWYCLLSAKDALVRTRLHLLQFSEARIEIESLPGLVGGQPIRTVKRHVDQLNTFYRERLARQTVFCAASAQTTRLKYRRNETLIQSADLRELVHLFGRQPKMTAKKMRHSLAVSDSKIEFLIGQLSEKLMRLSLPRDAVYQAGSSWQFVPSLKLA